MNLDGCTLNDAFGFASGYSTTMARKEERRKAKRCKGPQATFFDIKDPDRQHLNELPEIPAMNPNTGLREHVPVYAPEGSMEPFANQSQKQQQQQQQQKQQKRQEQKQQDIVNNVKWEEQVIGQQVPSLFPRTDDDPKGDKMRNSLPNILQKNAIVQPSSSSYFGKDPDEGFANFQPDSNNFLLEPSKTPSPFPGSILQGLTLGSKYGDPNVPVPSVIDEWKPSIASNPFKYPGANTSYIERLPPNGGSYPGYPWGGGGGGGGIRGVRGNSENFEVLTKKMDRIIARLDDMQRSGQTPEQSQTEIMMFIGSGVFVLFLLDLLMKKGIKLF
jgi:hypothetical protein